MLYSHNKSKSGFSLLEMLIVVAIIGILASVILNAVGTVRGKARDVKRKAEISQFGRLFGVSCYLPDAGEGVYDLKYIVDEMVSKNADYAKYVSQMPRDPSTEDGDTETLYKYIVTAEKKCALYANFESESQAVTLPNIQTATPGAGTGVFEATTPGWNGSTKYFQVSN